jgi:murein DD-endopeptidase MepM/ murein hydrolase activator NlpD
MKPLWMTATAFALCVVAAPVWAEPSSPLAASPNAQLLLRIATESTTHHKRHKHATTTTTKTHGKTKRSRHRGSTTVAASRHGRRHHAAPSEIRTSGGGTVKVGRHDTLFSIAKRSGVSVEELARLNHLKKPYHVRAGERIKLPARRYYVVKNGETLFSLARRFGVETAELAALNGMKPGGHVRSGQRLYLPASAAAPAATEQAAAERYRPGPRPTTPYTTVAPTPYTPPSSLPQPLASAQQPGQPPTSQGFQIAPSSAPAEPGQPAQGRLVPSAAPPSAAEVAAAGKGKFTWPVAGQVISGFGPKPDGQRNDGVNVSGSPGDAVRAAADGEVVYAGDQVPSFGNLVLIKHAGGWVTAYAHMAHILVKNRDQVTQGQQIGDVGQTGQVAAPQLHFEIRYAPSARDKAVPIDPMLVLPQR